MVESGKEMLDSRNERLRQRTQLLVELQQVNSIVNSLSGCLEPAEIARKVTDGLSELRSAVTAVTRGEYWGITAPSESICLSDREQEIIRLLATGLRDRDIASQLIV